MNEGHHEIVLRVLNQAVTENSLKMDKSIREGKVPAEEFMKRDVSLKQAIQEGVLTPHALEVVNRAIQETKKGISEGKRAIKGLEEGATKRRIHEVFIESHKQELAILKSALEKASKTK